VLSSLRYLLSDLWFWVVTHRVVSALAILILAAAAAGAWLLVDDSGSEERIRSAPGPSVVIQTTEPDEADDLGFPAFATKNTTRVAGPDPVASAAGVALAVYPSTGGAEPPAAVSLVESENWAAGIAAASLVAEPVGAPILLAEGEELPRLSQEALGALDPPGSPETEGRQAFAIGSAARPDDLRTEAVEGSNAAELAAGVERLRTRLAGDPDHIVVTTSDAPEYAMPAAGWAARSGDPVLFVNRDGVPEATAEAIERHPQAPLYVLGPQSAIPSAVIRELDELGGTVERIGAEGPVESAIAFARFADGTFGWNINDPGHGFVIANTARPIDAAGASPLSAAGSWGPLLVTDDAEELPVALRSLLLDLKPGYEIDPTRAVYNHVWLIGDESALSTQVQAQIDDLAEVAPVRSGPG
jgi:hypothetical protein